MFSPYTSDSLEMQCLGRIASDLRKLNISPNCRGYLYLCHAILLAALSGKPPRSIKAELFPKIANLYETKVENVERSCRHALDTTYYQGGFKILNKVLGCQYLSPYEKPSLTNFISTFAEKYIIKMNKIKLNQAAKKNEKTKKGSSLKSNKLFSPALNFFSLLKRNISICHDISL